MLKGNAWRGVVNCTELAAVPAWVHSQEVHASACVAAPTASACAQLRRTYSYIEIWQSLQSREYSGEGYSINSAFKCLLHVWQSEHKAEAAKPLHQRLLGGALVAAPTEMRPTELYIFPRGPHSMRLALTTHATATDAVRLGSKDVIN